MRKKLKRIYFRWAYLDRTGDCVKEQTYFYRFSREIGRSNLNMMRSMSVFMLIISLLMISMTFTYFGTVDMREVYGPIAVLESILICLLQWLIRKEVSPATCMTLTALHLFHMLAIGGYIGVFYCMEETAVIFVVVLTISAVIFTLPSLLSMGIATLCTAAMIAGSYYLKDAYWFESDALNGVSVLIFSILFGWRINLIRAEEAFAREDALRLNDELKKISVTDQLTGLYNHRSFQDSYYEMFRRASAQGLPLGVIMMDLDKFKSYNDHYGHVAGDDCLGRVGETIANCVPKGTIVCRYGGEEFIALLDETLCDRAETIAEEIRRAVAALEIPHAYTGLDEGVITMSLGAHVEIPAKDGRPMDLVERADQAMYQSKEDGRNRSTITYAPPSS